MKFLCQLAWVWEDGGAGGTARQLSLLPRQPAQHCAESENVLRLLTPVNVISVLVDAFCLSKVVFAAGHFQGITVLGTHIPLSG